MKTWRLRIWCLLGTIAASSAGNAAWSQEHIGHDNAAPTLSAAQDADEATRLDGQANNFYRQGRYSEAEPLYQRSLAIREKALGPNHPDIATVLNNLANLCRSQGRYADCEPLAKRSLAIREGALGPIHPDVATSLNSLAGLYEDQGRYADAGPLFDRSLAIREKVLGPNHPDVATSLNNLANLYNNQGRYAEAEPLLKRSLEIDEKALGPSHRDLASSLNNLANVYFYQSRYVDAKPLYQRSLAIREEALGPDHPDVAVALNNLARLYYTLGRRVEAEPLIRRSLLIRETALGPDHPKLAFTLNHLAFLYDSQGRYADAEPLYLRSLAIREKALGPDHLDVATSLNNVADVYSSQGRHADAEPLFKRSLQIYEKALGPDHPDVGETLKRLASLYLRQGRHADADPLFEQSLAIVEKALGPDHPDVATSLNDLAILYSREGRYPDAEAMFKRAIAIYEKVLGPDHPDAAIAPNNLVGLYNDQSRYAEALPIIKHTIDSYKATKWTTLGVLIGSQKTNLIDAEQSFSDSYNVLQFTSSSAAADAVTKLAQRFAAGTSELASLVRDEQDLSSENETVDKAVIAASSKVPNKRDPDVEDQLRKRLADIQTEREKIRASLSQRFPEYLALAKPPPLTLQETQELLGDDEAVVAFDIDDRKSYAWVITKTDGSWSEIPTKTKELNEHVKQLRLSLTSEQPEPFDAGLAYKIYNSTFEPIVQKLAGKKRLSIFANGALTSVPFGLFVTADPSGKSLKDVDWLINSYAVTVIPSIYSLKTMRAVAGLSTAPKPMIAFADPVFSKRARLAATAQPASRSLPSFYQGTQIDVALLAEYLPQLKGTRVEVTRIAKELNVDVADIKLGLDATEAAVKSAKLDDYKIVYFATHGLVSGDLPQFSKFKAEPALALTIPDNPTELDDGLLQASDRNLNSMQTGSFCRPAIRQPQRQWARKRFQVLRVGFYMLGRDHSLSRTGRFTMARRQPLCRTYSRLPTKIRSFRTARHSGWRC